MKGLRVFLLGLGFLALSGAFALWDGLCRSFPEENPPISQRGGPEPFPRTLSPPSADSGYGGTPPEPSGDALRTEDPTYEKQPRKPPGAALSYPGAGERLRPSTAGPKKTLYFFAALSKTGGLETYL